MKYLLSDIADIYYGPHEKGLMEGGIKYLVSSHFDDFLQPTMFKDSYIDTCKDLTRYKLQPNDVIVTGKGHRAFAWAYDPAFGDVVPSSLFYILRLFNPDIILSSYLASYLNSVRIHHKLKSLGAGTSVPSIQKSELAKLTVLVPSLVEQKKIVELANLMDHDVKLTSQLLEKKKAMKSAVINQIINSNIKSHNSK